ncbi:MAG: DnaB-like helicase C-terminal domain-containing protein [Gemmatimonadales bacterium]|nr:DnaB-like helicase C-terminal domain-containing protein [Gemmatimonadales bacterium]
MNQRLPTGFPALDLILGGGLRREDLVVLGGDSGSGCSSLALGIAVRVAQQGHAVAMLSTEMSATRLAERALALSARATLDELAGDGLDDRRRVEIAEVALRLRDLPIGFRAQPVEGWPIDLTQVQDGWDLLVVDCLEGLEVDGLHGAEAAAARIASLKRLAIARHAAVLLVVHAGDAPASRADRRPLVGDFTASGAIRQHADVILGLYREELYTADLGVAGAAEVQILKDRHGSGGTVDLYFTPRWLRFEDLGED